MDVTVPSIPESYDELSGHAARLPGRPQADLGMEATHRGARARPGDRRGEAARVHRCPLRRRVSPLIAFGPSGGTRSNSASSSRSWPERASPTCWAIRWWPARSSTSAPTSSGRPTCRAWRRVTTSGPSCSASRTPEVTSPDSRPVGCATATPTSSRARRSGAHGRSGRTSATSSLERSLCRAPAVSRRSSSTCAVPAWRYVRSGK